MKRQDAYTLAISLARRSIRDGQQPAQAVREACDRYRSAITTAAEIRMVRQLRKESE